MKKIIKYVMVPFISLLLLLSALMLFTVLDKHYLNWTGADYIFTEDETPAHAALDVFKWALMMVCFVGLLFWSRLLMKDDLY